MVPSQHLPGMTEESNRKPQDSGCPGILVGDLSSTSQKRYRLNRPEMFYECVFEYSCSLCNILKFPCVTYPVCLVHVRLLYVKSCLCARHEVVEGGEGIEV